MQFSTPTPIQARAIPMAMAGKDVLGVAQTGTGKTAAFCIPILERLVQSPNHTGLILTPTRELAMQIHAFWMKLAQYVPGMHAVLLVGGNSMQPQTRALQRRPRLIIGTPGRIIDHLQRRTLRLNNVAMLVLDEADRMLDMGFTPQLNEIRKHLPDPVQSKRQTMFFTATWEERLNALAQRYLVTPERITVDAGSKPAALVTQSMVMTSQQSKNQTLLDELTRRQGSVLVFTRTQHRADRVARYLGESGIQVNRIHGGRTQAQRNAALSSFRAGQIRVLVATDIASRGIDVASVAHVVNYDLPQTSDDYVHRIGRTGRAGVSGEAVSLVTPEDRSQWKQISGGGGSSGSGAGGSRPHSRPHTRPPQRRHPIAGRPSKTFGPRQHSGFDGRRSDFSVQK